MFRVRCVLDDRTVLESRKAVKSYSSNNFVACKQNYRIWQGETRLRKEYILPSFKIKSGSKCMKKRWI